MDFGIITKGVLDLRDIEKFCMLHNPIQMNTKSHPINNIKNRNGNSLYSLTLKYCNMNLDKDELVRCSDWSIPLLSTKQIIYAALDACIATYIVQEILRFYFITSTSDILKIFEKCLISEENITKRKNNRKIIKDENLVKSLKPIQDSTSGDKVKEVKKKKSRIEARKTSMYDNCKIVAPDGELLSTCSLKKLRWYVSRGLGTVVEKGNEGTASLHLQLNFEPSGRASVDEEEYYITDKSNSCVVCGHSEEYLRHSIVPTQYRQFFPDCMKNHLSHDILLLCLQCNERCGIHDYALSSQIAEELSAPLGGSGNKFEIDFDVKRLRSSCLALLKRRSGLPAEAVLRHEEKVRSYLGLGAEHLLDQAALQRCLELESQRPRDHWRPHGEMVVTALRERGLQDYYAASGASPSEAGDAAATVEALGGFVRRWRRHFLSCMQPLHLPPNWNVDSKVTNSTYTDCRTATRRRAASSKNIAST